MNISHYGFVCPVKFSIAKIYRSQEKEMVIHSTQNEVDHNLWVQQQEDGLYLQNG